jgi:hypothetical protein
MALAALVYGPARIAVRDGVAEAFLAAAREVGTQIGLVHQGGAEVVLWALTDKDNTAPRAVNGVVTEPEVRTFTIPRQAVNALDGTGAFDGGISENDEIRWIDQTNGGDTYYVVLAGTGSWDMDGFEAVYNVRAVMTTVRRSTGGGQ